MPARNPRLIAVIVACALFMENLDSTVIATALPQIARSLGTSPIHLSLAITSYLLSLAVFIPISGWVADRLGSRTVFRAAIIVFTLGSVLCGFSSSLGELAGARMLQGLGGAMMVPVGRLVVLRSVSKAEMVSVMAYLTMPALVGPILGPPVGGFLATYASWRWIFFLNVPIGILGFILVTIFIPERREPDTPPLDVAGFLFSGIGLAGLMLGFETIGRPGLPTWVSAVMILVGAVATTLYLRHARRTPFPILDLGPLRLRTFAAALTGGTLFRIGIGALPFLLPLMLQVGFGMSAFQSGLLTFMSAAGALAMKLTARPILHWLGYRTTLTANALLSASFLAAYSLFRPDTPHLLIIGMLLAGGFFRSLQFTAVNTLAFAEVGPEMMRRASTLWSTMQQLSLTIGVAAGAGLLNVTLAWTGGERLGPNDFWPAFLAVAFVSAASAIIFARLPADAGAELSGRGVAAVVTEEETATGTPARPVPAR